jgi:hypothetical protein
MNECEISEIELMFLAQSFGASEFDHRLGRDNERQLTEYRKNSLRNPKVQKALYKLILHKFVPSGRFSEAIDRFINSLGPRQPADSTPTARRS